MLREKILPKNVKYNKEKEIYLPNKESISGHICEKTNKAAK